MSPEEVAENEAAFDKTVREMRGSMDSDQPTLTVADLENIARVCHEANRAYCHTLGDHSQPSWDDAPDWQRQSAMTGVRGIFDGRIKQPRDSHLSWMREKEADGWIYGETKDPEQKTHPCMVSFESLPKEQQAKDHLFFSTATTLIAQL